MDENVQTKFLQAVEIVQNEANFDDGNGNSLSNDEKLRVRF